MPFTLNAPPGLNDLPDVALAAEEIAQGQHAAKILENTKFGTVRPEFFPMGRFRDGETVPLPKSKADKYQYQASEVIFLWSPAITANPVNGKTSHPGAILFMDMWVEQAGDPSPGLVHTKVFYHVQGGQTEPSQDGELNVFAVGVRGTGVISLSAVPTWTDLADTAFDTDSTWRTDRLTQLNANAKRGVVQAELLDMGEFAHGQTVPAPVSPVDGHIYANAEIEWLPCWRWTPHFTTGIATGGVFGATLSRIQVSVSAARVVSSIMTYRAQGPFGPEDMPTNDGRIHVFAFCFRSGVALSGTVSFSDLDSSKFAGGKKALEPDTLVLSRNARFAAVRPEFFVTTRRHGQMVALPTSPLDGYAYTRAELRYFYIRQDTWVPGVIGSLLTLHGFIRQDTGVVTLNTFYLKSGSSPTQTNTNNGTYRVITVATRSEDAVSDAGTPDPTGGEPGFGGGVDNDLISGGGILLMRNPDFESGDRDWTKSSGQEIVEDAVNSYDGDWVAKKSSSTSGEGLRQAVLIPVQVNDRVMAACMAKKTAGPGSCFVRIIWLDSNKAEMSASSGNVVTSATYTNSRVVGTAPVNAFFAKVGFHYSALDATSVFYADQFTAAFFPIDFDDVLDSPTRFGAAEAGANKTETRTAAGIAGQGALATLGAAAWSSQVSGRPVELTDGRVAGALRSDKTYADPALFLKSAVRKETTAFVVGSTISTSWTTVDSFTRKLSPGTTKFLCTLECIVTPDAATAWEGRARIKIGSNLSAEVVVASPATSNSAAVMVTGLTGDTAVTVEVQAIRIFSIGGPPAITGRFTQTTPADDDTSHWSI